MAVTGCGLVFGCTKQVNPVLCFSLIDFPEMLTNFKKLYLELGLSNLGEPNFVGFIMKCTI